MPSPFFNKLPKDSSAGELAKFVTSTSYQLAKATLIGATTLGIGTGTAIGYSIGKNKGKHEAEQAETASKKFGNK